MRVTMATIFGNIQANLQNLAEELQYINASIASGQKYQRISDNPVDVGLLLGLNQEDSMTTQYERNLQTAGSWLAVTSSTLGAVNVIVQSAKALAEQMATGTYTAAQRQSAAQQVQGFIEQVMQVGNTQFGGKYLLAGYRTATQPFRTGDWQVQPAALHLQGGSTGTATSGGMYTGSASRTYLVEMVSGGGTGMATYRVSTDGGQNWTAPAVIPGGPAALGDGVEVTFGGDWLAGDRFSISVYQPIEYQGDEHELEIAVGPQSRLVVNRVGCAAVGGDQGATDLFQILARLKSSLEANDAAGVGASLTGLGSYQVKLLAMLAGLGASQDQVAVKTEITGYLKDELTTQISDKGDTDLVEAVNLLKMKETAYQAALLASSKVMGMSLLDYL